MYHSQLTDATFYNSLLALDRIIAEQVKQSGCLFCHGHLHQSHYPRKPRGVPAGTQSDYPIRFSYCCGKEGCRKRFTPPSMRFLSRKVYSSVIIFLVFLLKSKTDELKVEELNLLLGTSLSVETVRRWRTTGYRRCHKVIPGKERLSVMVWPKRYLLHYWLSFSRF